MSTPRKKPIRILWRSSCTTCRAFFQCCYSAFVLLLAAATIFSAYVATLDDVPVPKFIVRELQSRLQNDGLALRMQGIRFQTNGRVIFDQPELYSQELGSTLFAAEAATVKIKLTHLLFGSLAIDEISLSAGRFILPAMLTPSGQPSTAIKSINLEASHRGQRWKIHYANCAIDDLKLSIAGLLDDSLLQRPPPQPDGPKTSPTQTILKLAPQVARLQKELKRIDSPFCIVDLSVLNKKQSASIHLGSERLRVAPNLQIHDLILQASFTQDSELEAKFHARQADLPQNLGAHAINLEASWGPNLPPLQLLPDRIRASATQITYQGATLPSAILTAEPGEEQHRAIVSFSLPDRPIVARIEHDIASKRSSIDLAAELDQATLLAIEPIAQAIAKLKLSELASLESSVDLHLLAQLDADFKHERIEAHVQSGGANVRGAAIDYARVHATLVGPQIDIDEIHLATGEQRGNLAIGYNLETLLRRILVEGSFDPTLINAWFGPWWAAMWDGMVFPKQGMLTYLDSQGIFKRPDTIRVTGTGYVRDIDVRGMQAEELRTRIFSLFRYVDLYDLELTTTDGQQAIGEIQFHMDRDTRDEKDKLTGIWIQADSTLDVKQAPSLLWEIAEPTARILEPYCYDLPPFISARSSSVRREDQFLNDIDLQIEAESGFTFYGFPFDSLDAFVHIGDDIIDIPRAEANLGGGQIKTSAFITGDGLEISAQIETAGFGELLNAANTYFAQSGSERAKAMDTEHLLAFGGKIDAHFDGNGIVGDPYSFLGQGAFDITKADFGSFRLLGLLSIALEITPFKSATTLKFSDASAPIRVDRKQVHISKGKIQGPVAVIETDGNYNLETDEIKFAARLFPMGNFKLPLISTIIKLPLNILSHVAEISVTGTFDQPQIRLFNPSTKEEIRVDSKAAIRDARPSRN